MECTAVDPVWNVLVLAVACPSTDANVVTMVDVGVVDVAVNALRDHMKVWMYVLCVQWSHHGGPIMVSHHGVPSWWSHHGPNT